MQIVINRCYGGFSLSVEAVKRYAEIKGIKIYPFTDKLDKNGHIIVGEFEPYTNEKVLCVHYSKAPLTPEGTYVKGSYFTERDIARNDPALVQVVKELGEDANGRCAELEVIEIPDDVDWVIGEYDGIESVEERHRSWP